MEANEIICTNCCNWINIFGLITIVLILFPNIIYAIKFRVKENKCNCCRSMYILEQIGRYGSIFLMSFNIGIAEFGFASEGHFLAYLIANVTLIIAYYIVYALYFKQQSNWESMALAIIPSCIFLIDGLLLRHYPLVSFAIIFAFSHICITRKDSCKIDSNKPQEQS
ncbi:MAG: hypothetical protein J6W06_06750 [Bacteroidales bacterium]|nr:hypothetical protein [Bacteroidales bacterium]